MRANKVVTAISAEGLCAPSNTQWWMRDSGYIQGAGVVWRAPLPTHCFWHRTGPMGEPSGPWLVHVA